MNIIVKKAETQEEIDAAEKLAQEVYVDDYKYVDIKDYIRATEPYKKCSTIFIAVKDGEVVGTVRVVSHHCIGNLPIEESFDLPSFVEKEKTLEVTRTAIKKTLRGDKKNHEIFLKMYKELYDYIKKNNYRYLCGNIHSKILGTFLKIGWNFKWIGEPRMNSYGVFLTPIVLEIKDENVKFEYQKV